MHTKPDIHVQYAEIYCRCVHILIQMWDGGLREVITQTNRTGQGLMGKLGETFSVISAWEDVEEWTERWEKLTRYKKMLLPVTTALTAY